MKEIRDILDQLISGGDELKRLFPSFSYDHRQSLRDRVNDHLIKFSALLELIDEGTMGIGDLQDLLFEAEVFHTLILDGRTQLSRTIDSQSKAKDIFAKLVGTARHLEALSKQWLKETCNK